MLYTFHKSEPERNAYFILYELGNDIVCLEDMDSGFEAPMKKGEEAHNSLLNKVPKGKKTNIPGDTASGIFCLGVLLLAASVAAPISAPVSAILIIL